MTHEFDNWGIDVYVSGAWVALKDDVLQNPGARWSQGVLDNGPLDRVGAQTTLVFYLRNDAQNSVGTLGYYSPGHASAMSGWTTGLAVRLWFEFEGYRRYKFYGLIEPSGITVDAGAYGARRVRVSVQNWMTLAGNHEMNLTSIALNQTIEDAVALILANMAVQPLATEYGSGSDTFPTVFDASSVGGSALSEFDKLAVSEFGMIYTKGDATGGETLVVEGRDTRSSVTNTQLPLGSDAGFLLLEDGDYLLLEDGGRLVLTEYQEASFDNVNLPDATRIGYGRHQANRIRGITAVRRIDAAATTILYDLPAAIEMSAGQTLTVRGSYRDPSGGASYVNADTSSMTKSHTANAAENGGGADKTSSLTVTAQYGTSEVEFTLVASEALWVTALQAIGKGIYLYDPLSLIYEDSAAQANGIFQTTFDMAYQDDPSITAAIAEYTLGLESVPNVTVDRYPMIANADKMRMFGFLMLEPGTRAHFAEAMSGVDGDYFINGYEAEMFTGRYVIFSPVLKGASASAFAQWDIGQWDNAAWSFPA